ncbi:MAG: alpha/beta hydrolase [Verrucomicrobiia bacterium]
MRKRLMTYPLVILAVFVLMALWLRWREPSMIYYPTRDIEQTPDRLGWKFEDVYLTTADAVKINGWFVPAPQSPLTTHQSPLTVLFLHGNAGNISHRLEKLAFLRELGADVFIIDYRGYGHSEGAPNEQGTYRDAQAAYEYLTKTRGTDPRHIIVYGESLGSAVAVDLAAKHPVVGVVIEESLTSVADVGQKMFPFMPVRLLVRNKYDTLSKIGRINAPLLIFHSRDDEYFSWRHAERLFAAAREPKQLVELRGGHNDAFLASADTYRTGLRDFLARLR